jgi:hypothetical protein
MTNRNIIFILACTLAVLAPSSCQENEPEGTQDSRRIGFHIEENRAEDETKANTVEGTELKLEVGGHSIGMSFAEEPNTKAAELDNSTNPISKIYVTAIEHDRHRYYFKDSNVDITAGTGLSDHFWPSQNLSFFAYTSSKEGTTPVPDFRIESSQYKGSFSYSLPSPTSSPRKDASAQPDIIFAITPDQSVKNSPTVSLMFHHALSALIFKTGKMPDNVHLNSITISDVYSSGSCTMTATGDKDLIFTWSYAGKEQNGSYTEVLDQDAVAGEQMGSKESVFMMLPQKMSDETELSLSFSIEGREYTMVKKFKEITQAWEADKKYVFTIGLPDEIDVEVEDRVEGLVKKDLTILNTGIATGYIRAAIIGYWKNTRGEIISPWKSEEGIFDWGTDWSIHWRKGDDGFYYHKTPVKYMSMTHPLFNTYTLTEQAKENHPGLTLELSIVAQIVPEDNVSVWGI